VGAKGGGGGGGSGNPVVLCLLNYNEIETFFEKNRKNGVHGAKINHFVEHCLGFNF